MIGSIAASDNHLVEWWGEVNYAEALDKMNAAHSARVAGSGPDCFFYLEHSPIITYGRATPSSDLLPTSSTIPRVSVPRGGLATYHAPGQMVGYIIMDLAHRANGQRPDIHAYLRAIELGLIKFLRTEFDLSSGLRDGFTGVWTLPETDDQPGRKLASIGVSARKWVTTHGFALNIHPDMAGFQEIVPCGIRDATMTSVQTEMQRSGNTFVPQPMQQWAIHAHQHIVEALRNQGWLCD